MKTLNISIGDSDYKVIVADNDLLRQRGLMNVNKLPEGKGMLFIFDEVGNNEMWMKNTLIPLQQIFMDEDKEVIKTITRKPEDETLIGCEGTKYVLEVNPTDSIEVGDIMEIEGEEFENDSEDNKTPIMKVLAPDGSTLMELKGGERIVSRKETRILIKKAKKAALTDGDQTSAFKSLGKYMFKVLKGQDDRKPEYVQAPK